VRPIGLLKRVVPTNGDQRRLAIKYAIGLAMLGAAIFLVATNHEAVSEAWDHARHAHPAIIVAALVLPVANVVAIAVSFWLLNKRYADVPLGETFALIASAWLLNFLPMRPGMVGRIAYHKRYHGIGVRASAKVLGINMILTAVSVGLLLLIVVAKVLISRAEFPPGATGLVLTLGLMVEQAEPWRVWIPILSMPAMLLTVAAWLLKWGRRRSWRITATLVARYVDLLIWVARYAVVFALVGRPLSMPEAVAIAVVSQIAQLVPLAGNGLGLRELAVGATAGVLPSGARSRHGMDALGLAADLVNRGAEFVAAAPVGVAAIGWLAIQGRLRLHAELGEEEEEPDTPEQPARLPKGGGSKPPPSVDRPPRDAAAGSHGAT